MKTPPMLVALAQGLPSFADSLECEDLTGPRTLFGPDVKMPRPVGLWSAVTDDAAVAANKSYARSMVLWKPGAPGPRDAVQGTQDPVPELPVAAFTLLAGKCGSTFDLAWKLHEDGLLPPWGAVLAVSQRSGRGRLRREWHSPPGNLHVTFRLPDDPLLRGDHASVVSGCLVAAAMRRLGFTLSLKWPNDLLNAAGEKVGGILLEERGGTLLAGLGLNLASAPDPALLRAGAAATAATLVCDPRSCDSSAHYDFLEGLCPSHGAAPPCGFQGSGTQPLCGALDRRRHHENGWSRGGTPPAPVPLWGALVDALIVEYTACIEGEARERVLAAAEELLVWKGRSVILNDGDEVVFGALCGLGQRGGVLLRRPGERRTEAREYFSGSISLA